MISKIWAVLPTVPKTKTIIVRKLPVTESYYIKSIKSIQICDHNKSGWTSFPFFLNYQKGKCTIQKIGINKFGGWVRKLLSIFNYRIQKRTLGTAFVDHQLRIGRRTPQFCSWRSWANMTTLKRHGGWKSSSVAEGYI